MERKKWPKIFHKVLSRIYAFSSVKFLGLKLRLFKKKDKYEYPGMSLVSEFHAKYSFGGEIVYSW